MSQRVRPYLFYDGAVSICSRCFRKVDAKIILQDERVYMLKRCPRHGSEKVLLADDVGYYRMARESFIKAPEQALHYNTPLRWGCPYDCGLCPDHEQHSCISVVEVTDACNLRCPICYADSGPHRPSYRSLEHIERMLDAVVRNEGEPDVVQISGGEPTIHPDFFEILDAAKARPIQHLMINTNGIRIAREPEFAERLCAYQPGLEIYLQFDSLERRALMTMRGADLRTIREQAVERCDALGLDVTLVVTVMRGQNDHEMGAIIEWALEHPSVRGVTFQPVQAAGRLESYDPARDRLTLTEVRRKILEQSERFTPEDILPVPCHPDHIAMAYALKLGGEVIPLTSMVPLEALVEGSRNTIALEKEARLREEVFETFSTALGPQAQEGKLRDLLCCLPQVETPPEWGYQNLFRVIILEFIDAHGFDLRAVRKSCVHIVHPDGRLIPFDTYNLFYRDDLEEERLAPLRAEILPFGG